MILRFFNNGLADNDPGFRGKGEGRRRVKDYKQKGDLGQNNGVL